MPVSGAKNSALKLMAATLLAPGKTTLQNVPDISDVHVMGKVLKGMGATIEVLDEHTLEIDTSQVDSWEAPYELVAKMRASTAVMGPLLGRFHRAKIAMPGGCNLGARKIDMHILGLEALGVEFDTAHGYINASAPQGLHGTTVTLEFASVGATENLIMAAVRAQGTTVIDNAAREPEIVDLANMLNEMGAKIVGAGTPVVTIEGVEELHPVTHCVVGDRIEAGTFIVAGALMADAWHHRSDAMSSVGAFVGIFGARMGYPILDPIASVVICLLIGKASIDIFRDAVDKMVDRSCDRQTEESIRRTVLAVEGVKGVDLLQTRLFGSKIYVDLEIAADGTQTLDEAHQIAEHVHHAIEHTFPDVKHCMVHVNPTE